MKKDNKRNPETNLEVQNKDNNNDLISPVLSSQSGVLDKLIGIIDSNIEQLQGKEGSQYLERAEALNRQVDSGIKIMQLKLDIYREAVKLQTRMQTPKQNG